MVEAEALVAQCYAPYMTLEKTDEVYGRLLREFTELKTLHAACASERRRIGENFKAMSADLIERPGALAMDWLSFDKDVSVIRKLLGEFSDLTAKLANKRREIEEFGPLPSFN
jgi:hypothetical protein